MGSVKLKDLKTYVRYDGNGRVVAGSLVFRKKKPKNGRWVEIAKNLCCDPQPNPSTTSTSTTSGGGGTPTAWLGFLANLGRSDLWAWNACHNTGGSSLVVYTSTTADPFPANTALYADASLTTLIPYTFGSLAINGIVYEVQNGHTNPLGGNGTPCIYVTTTTTTSSTTAAPTSCPTLGRAGNFAVIAASTITNTGSSSLFTNLALYPGTSVTGFPPGFVGGTQHITDAAAQNAKTDAQSAFTAFNLLTPTGSVAADIGGTTITPGIYSVSSSLAITGTVTLNGGGNPNAVFVFLIPSTFIPATSAVVSLTNSAQAGNVYWIVGSSATLNSGADIKGNIIAQASVTLTAGAALQGRAIALTGAVTLDSSIVNNTEATCTINPLA